MIANRTDRGSTQVNEMMRAVLSLSICLAVDPRKPSGPAAEWPNDKAGYTTASAGFRHHRSKAQARVEWSIHVVLFEQDGADEANDSGFVGEDADDRGASLDLAVGRSMGLVECSLARCCAGKLM
jgi:hypothetical protein